MRVTDNDDNPTPQRSRRPAGLTTSRPPSSMQRLLTIQQAVHEYGLPLGTLRDLTFRGAIPRVQLPDGRRWWFDRRDLDRFVETSKTREATA